MTAHASFNDAIRRAAGRGTVSRLERDAPVKVGSIGVGRGGACNPPRPPSASDRLNREIRAAAGIVRGHYTVDDLWKA
jgi:hypothetical protein